MHDVPRRYLHGTWPLLIGMGVLMLGAGLQGTLIGLRAALEEFPTFVIGVVMSCYYVGYVGGSFSTPQLVQRVGHIRVFAALTAVASASILLQGLLVSPALWAVLRIVSGFCFAGIYVVAESWLNDRATNQSRGSLLAVYMLVLYVGLGAGQFLLNAADPAGPILFILTSMLISLSVVPITLSVQRAPEFEVGERIALAQLYRISPLGVVGVTVSGMLTSSLFSMGSVYARLNGFASADIATFMAVMILAAVFTQLPIGRLSDRRDRRSVLVAVCVLAACLALGAAVFGSTSRATLLMLAAGFGGIVLTLYSLSLSHINDHLAPAQMVSASGSVILMNGAGAIAGPPLMAVLMDAFGPPAYFGSMAVLVSALAVYTLWRKRQRAPVPVERKARFGGAQPQAVSGQLVAEAAQSVVLGREERVTR
jgi:MFS family permease